MHSIPSKQAFETASALGDAGKWPPRGLGNRLAPIASPRLSPSFKIEKGESVFTIGSCFARNIEEYLDRLGISVPVLAFPARPEERPGSRPRGVLNKYTPPSILQELDRALRFRNASQDERDSLLSETLVEIADGRWIDLELSGNIPVTRERAIERRAQVCELFLQAFESDIVTLTYGLTEAWFDRERGRYINLAPPVRFARKHPDRYAFEMLSYETSRDHIERAVQLLTQNGVQRIIITVSPVPLGRTFVDQDIIIANTEAKSLLRAAVADVTRQFGQCDYFPSYEMATLTKDPSIWHDDQLHLRDAFVGRIVRHLLNGYASHSLIDREQLLHDAWHALKARDNEEALSVLDSSAMRSDPTAATLRGIAQVQSGQKLEGMGLILEHAMNATLNPKQAIRVAGLVLSHDPAKAAIIITLALKREELEQVARRELHARLALARAKEDRADLVQDAIDIALSGPTEPKIILDCAQAYQAIGRSGKAKDLFQQAYDGMPQGDTPSPYRGAAMLGLMDIALDERDYRTASMYGQEAVRCMPKLRRKVAQRLPKGIGLGTAGFTLEPA